MKFYCVTDKKWTDNIPEDKVKYKMVKTASGRKQKMAYAGCKHGHHVAKFVKM
jgi:hypothetical protein